MWPVLNLCLLKKGNHRTEPCKPQVSSGLPGEHPPARGPPSVLGIPGELARGAAIAVGEGRALVPDPDLTGKGKHVLLALGVGVFADPGQQGPEQTGRQEPPLSLWENRSYSTTTAEYAGNVH